MDLTVEVAVSPPIEPSAVPSDSFCLIEYAYQALNGIAATPRRTMGVHDTFARCAREMNIAAKNEIIRKREPLTNRKRR